MKGHLLNNQRLEKKTSIQFLVFIVTGQLTIDTITHFVKSLRNKNELFRKQLNANSF